MSENGNPTVKLMRYQCRPAGKPKFYDQKYPGTYNARRDNLTGFWKDLFGYKHGIMLATTFFENVSKHKVAQRELAEGEKEENVVLEFKPRGLDTMYVACLWSHWEEGGEALDSFAAITDEPPPEVAAAGHDRCIIPIKEENIDAWLNPDREEPRRDAGNPRGSSAAVLRISDGGVTKRGKIEAATRAAHGEAFRISDALVELVSKFLLERTLARGDVLALTKGALLLRMQTGLEALTLLSSRGTTQRRLLKSVT